MPSEALVDLRRRLASLPPRSAATRQVIREVAAAYDVSESTVYRALTPRPAPRAVQRVDQGTPRVLPGEQLEQDCEVIAALQLRASKKQGCHLPTAEAMRLLEVSGAEPPSGFLGAPAAALK